MEEIQSFQGEGVNQAGSPEHINEMLAKVDAPIDTHDAGLVKQDTPVTSEGRPVWLPDKFDSPEEMARAYSQLEQKFSSSNEQLQEIENTAQLEQQTAEIQDTSAPEVAQLLDNNGLDFSVFQQEYNQTGTLSKDAYEALEEAGLGPEVVNTWIQGQEAVADQQVNNIYDMVGGQESYNEMMEWANDNLEPWEVDAYNSQIGNLDPNSQFAVSGLQARYMNSIGNQAPTLYQGERASSELPKYESLAQLTSAMGDPRYAADPAFRRTVENKLNNSALF